MMTYMSVEKGFSFMSDLRSAYMQRTLVLKASHLFSVLHTCQLSRFTRETLGFGTTIEWFLPVSGLSKLKEFFKYSYYNQSYQSILRSHYLYIFDI